MLPETVDGLPDFVDGEGALLYLLPLGVLEDLREVSILFWVSVSSVSCTGVC